VYVGDEDEQAGKVLAAGRDAEFDALLDCVVGVSASIRRQRTI